MRSMGLSHSSAAGIDPSKCACDARATAQRRAAACNWRCVRSQRQSGSDSRGAGRMGLRLQGVWPWVCGTGCALQEGGQVGCEEGALGGGHAATAKERVMRTLCRRAAVPRIRLQPSAHRLWASSWLAPHRMAQSAACSL
jgi:hypothetical protein